LPDYGGEHRILVSREEAMDELTVQVEPKPALDEGRREALRRQAETRLRTALGVGAKVILVAPGSLERTEFKARRVIDNREVLRSG
jgi:phenylacetate-CoA ligase